ncbi:MAG: CocE/NonD family hydrolase [Planctomycetota bacterium]
MVAQLRIATVLVIALVSRDAPGQDVRRDPLAITEGTFVATITDQEIGRESFRLTREGWTARVSLDLSGQVTADFEASLARGVEQGQVWRLEGTSGGESFRVDAVWHEGEVSATITPGDRKLSFSVAEQPNPFFFENLLWTCLGELTREYAAMAKRSALVPGTLASAITVQTSTMIPVRLEEFSTYQQDFAGATVSFTLYRVLFSGSTEMTLVCTPDGFPVRILVPSQKLEVTLLGFDEVQPPGLGPITIVDQGPWREKLSQPVHEVIVEHKVMIPMGDGIKLAADVHRPRAAGRYPAILIRTPYNRATEGATKGAFYARRGYAVVAQDCRGRFESEGRWFPLENEMDDGSDTIDWIAAQPWCDGRVGMIGGSYVGWVQWYAAKSGNPHLQAIVPQVSPPDPHENIPYEGGVFLLGAAWCAKVLDFMQGGGTGIPALDWNRVLATLPLGDLDVMLGVQDSFLDEWLSHPPDDADYWDPLCYQTHFEEMTVPALHISGWFDGDQPGALQNFTGMRERAATEEARKAQYLVMGPWGHAFNVTRQLGDVDLGAEAVVDLDSFTLRFFDCYLKGIENGIEDEEKVLVFVMGENRWHREKSWPLPQTTFTKLYLQSGGKAQRRDGDGVLVLENLRGEAPPDIYRYDPAQLPESLADFNDLAGSSATADFAALPDRDDVLDYTSPPLASPVELTGPLATVLSVATDAADTDFAASIFHLTPDGKMRVIGAGIQRVRYRLGPRTDAPVPPNEIVSVTIDCWASSIRLEKGDRIRLQVSSTAFPGFARHLNTLEPIATAREPVVATNSVYHDATRPSYVVLPVIPREELGAIRFE